MLDVDAIINIIEKTSRTLFIKRIIKMKYFYKKNGNLYSSYNILSDYYLVFQADYF
jgi:hypothetical protein